MSCLSTLRWSVVEIEEQQSLPISLPAPAPAPGVRKKHFLQYSIKQYILLKTNYLEYFSL